MLKLNTSYSKKVPVPGADYSSQSCHISLEVELSDGLSREQIQERIHEIFDLARASVEDELRTAENTHHEDTKNTKVDRRESCFSGNRTEQKLDGKSPSVKASAKQLNFLTDLAIRHKMDIRTLEAEARRVFGVAKLADLSKQQASQMIDHFDETGGKVAA